MSKRKTNEQFIKEVTSLVGNDFLFLEEYKGSATKIVCKHIICGYEWAIKPSAFLYGSRCPKCAGVNKKNNEEFTREVYSLVGDEYVFLNEYINSNIKILCKHNECGYTWKIAPCRFLGGNRCPKCAGKWKPANNEFLHEIYKIVGNEYTFLETYIDSRTKILCKHNICGYEWKIRPDHILQGGRCPRCHIKAKKSNEKFVQEIYNLVGNKYIFLEEYVNNHTKILCRHNLCKHEWKIQPKNFLTGKRCPYCSTNKGKSQELFNKEVYNLVGEEYSFLQDYIDTHTKILCQHNECSYKWYIEPSSFLRGTRCPRCMGYYTSHEQFVSKIPQYIKNEFVLLDKYLGANDRVRFLHKECGHITNILSKHVSRGFLCSHCQFTSIGEKEIESILLNFNVKYKKQIIFNDCRHVKPLRFDFGVYDGDILLFLIEYQGEQHFKPIEFFGGENIFKQQCIRDQIKVDYCNSNEILLYTISYNEKTKEKLSLILKENLLIKEE